MLWYHLKTAAWSAAATLALASTAAADSYAENTWDFSDAEEFSVPAATSAVPLWMIVPYNRQGPYLWDGCELFLEEHTDALSGVTIPGCVGTIAQVSGISNPDRIPEGTMVMVPSPNNISSEIAAQRSERTNIQSLAANPMGMAEALLEFNRDIDEYNQSLEEVEGRLGEHDERLTSQADQLSDLETRVTTLMESTGADLSAAEVRSIATEVLESAALEPGMTEFEVQAQIRAALDEQRVEFEQLASDVEALRQELANTRSAQLTPEEYARTALEIARDLGVSEAQVETVVQTALADLDLVSPADMETAIESALTEVRSQVSTLEAQVNALQAELGSLRSEAAMSPEAYAQAAISIARDLGMSEAHVDQAVQTALADLDLVAPDDVSAAIEAALDERGYVSQSELETALQDADNGTLAWWVPWVSALALAVGVLTLLLLGLKSRRDKRSSKEFSENLEANKTETSKAAAAAKEAKDTADKATTEVGKAKDLAVKAMTTAKVAVDLHLKSDQRLKGDLPSSEELNKLAEDESVDVTIRKDDGTDVTVRFTRVTNLLDDGKGNRFDGFKVDGIRGLKQGVKMHPSNMLRIIANANKNNSLEGVGTSSAAVAA